MRVNEEEKSRIPLASKIDWQGSFESTTALSTLMLWLLFGFMTTMVNCDLQRLMLQNVYIKHAISLLIFFFLFTLIDSKSNLLTTWIKTLVIYVLFILATKSKSYYVLPVIGLLLIDQSIKRYKNEVQSASIHDKLGFARKVLNYTVIIVILAGAFDYYLIQKAEYKEKFSYPTFFLGTTKRCKTDFPKINRANII